MLLGSTDELYGSRDAAVMAMTEAAVLGDGLHSAWAVAQMLRDLDDTVDWLMELAALYGDRFQRTARRQHWQQAIVEMAYRQGVWL